MPNQIYCLILTPTVTLAWELLTHYLLSRRAGALIRTVAWMCMAGVGIGVFSLVVVVSVMNGFNQSIRRRLLAAEPHLVVTLPGVNSSRDLENNPLRAQLLKHSENQTQLFENQDVILRTVDGAFSGAVARGVDPAALGYVLREIRNALSKKDYAGTSGIETPPIEDESTRLAPGEVLLGIELARRLGIFEGDKLTVIPPEALLLPPGEAPPFEKVTVKGLLATNLPEIDETVLFYGRGKTFNAFGMSASRRAGYEIRLPNPENFSELRSEIEKTGAQVESWVDRNSSLFYALRIEKSAMSGFLGLSAIIASFSIVTVLVLLLTQKRKDIGLLMSLGLSPKQTRLLFVKVGLMLSSLGIVVGLVLGVVVCLVVDRYPIPILPDVYYDSTIPAKVEPLFVLCILIGASFIAFISAWLPARTTTRETPSEALRSRHQIHAEHP